MTNKKVMQMALDVLANNRYAPPIKEVIEALRAALAQPEKEWVGLTDEEINETAAGNVEGERMLPYSFARAIEAKLKDKNDN
jgi:hypothetical protein